MKEEEIEQRKLVAYTTAQYPKLLFTHIPNGEARPKKVGRNGKVYCPSGARLKAMGTRKSWPDVQFAEARGGYFGLYIEMKAEKGKVDPGQKNLLADLAERGYKTAVARSFESAKAVLDEYMAMPVTVVMKQA